MLDLSQPHALTDIVASVGAKTPIGSVLRTAQWEALPAALRDQAFFSAGVTQAEFLSRQKQAVLDLISRSRGVNDKGESYWKMDRALFIAQMRQLGTALGIEHPVGDRGGVIREGDITDPLSIARLRLVINTQLELAYGQADWLTGMDPDLLNAFPAWELVRIESRMMPRDWPARWLDAAQAVGWEGVSRDAFIEARMIALKTSPIWVQLSRFKNPHPPFDFNSGMGVEDIDRSEAESWNLIGPDDELVPNVQQHQELMQASVKQIGPQEQRRLKEIFGAQAVIKEDTVTWSRKPAAVAKPRPPSAVKMPSAAVKVTAEVNPVMAEAIQRVTQRLDAIAAPLRLSAPVNITARDGLGHYHYFSKEGQPLRIELGQTQGTPVLEAAHEVGHLWALTNLGGGDAQAGAPVDFTAKAEPWLRAVLDSAPVRALNAHLTDSPAPEAREILNYLLQPGELWARCFSQWYAVRSKDKQALMEHGRVLSDRIPGLSPDLYWDNASFKPLLQLLDDLLQP